MNQGQFDENNIVDIQTNNLAEGNASGAAPGRVDGMIEMNRGDKGMVRSQIIEGPAHVASEPRLGGQTSGGAMAGMHIRDSEELKISNARSPNESRMTNVKNSAATGETMINPASQGVKESVTIPATRGGLDKGRVMQGSRTSSEMPARNIEAVRASG